LDYKGMIKRFLKSNFYKKEKAWYRTEEAEDFYEGDIPDEKTQDAEILEDFFNGEPLEKIVEMFPDIWKPLKEEIKETLEYDVLTSPKTLEENLGGTGFRSYVEVPFNIDKYFEHIVEELLKALKEV